MRLVTTLAACSFATSVAIAGPLPADKHEPPVWADNTSTWIQVTTSGDQAYALQSAFQLYGATSKSDRFRVDIKQGNKIVGVAKCSNNYNEQQKLLYGQCAPEKDLKTSGPHTLDLIYEDDQEDKEYLVQTYRIDVRRWKSIGKSIEWGYTPDDLLAIGYVRHVEEDRYTKFPNFEFWTTGEIRGDLVLRCTVDGKKIPDFQGDDNNSVRISQDSISSSWTTEKTQKSYKYYRIGVKPHWTVFGPKPADPPRDTRYLIDNPGKWDCMLRKDGKPVRQFLFTVNDKGMVEPGELQLGSKNVKLPPDTVMIDMRIPKEQQVEKRIRQDALKKGVGWGLPWPDSPKSKEAQAAFPPTMGTPD